MKPVSTGVCLPGLNLNDPEKTERDLITAALELQQSNEPQLRNLGTAIKLFAPQFTKIIANPQMNPQDVVHAISTAVGIFAGMVVSTGVPREHHDAAFRDTMTYFGTACNMVVKQAQQPGNLCRPDGSSLDGHDYDDELDTGPTVFGKKKPFGFLH